ncbi:MAG: aminotransferase class I/II-fold pyridoxal phosphate-dependent enzyme, partial [Planctomycetota bacterium]
QWLRAAGGPYPVAAISLLAAETALEDTNSANAFIARVANERSQLTTLLAEHGAQPIPSQANYVTARFSDIPAAATRTALAQRGIAVRGFPNHPDLDPYLRITLPGNTQDFTRLTAALTEILGGKP